MAKADFYQEITDRIISALEAGVTPWACPWEVELANGLPFNASTGHFYSGMNTVLLWSSAMEQRFTSSAWLTMKQANKLGGRIRKGEKSTPLFFYSMVEKEKDDGKKEEYPMLKIYRVFNLDQIEGLSEDYVPEARTQRVDEFVASTGAYIEHYGQKAFYRPSVDKIVMPETPFRSTDDYYATLLHELTHWTGAKQRLDRKGGAVFGDKDYAFEELVAELGSAFLLAELGVTGTVQHDSYIASWLKALKNDKRYIFKAASQASKAHQYLVNLTASASLECAA